MGGQKRAWGGWVGVVVAVITKPFFVYFLLWALFHTHAPNFTAVNWSSDRLSSPSKLDFRC